ncbi:unnamed protein product [Paramecium sonneborni]|uniref:RING-type E3 ubiquitin transferase n=1 Tax=Paramecium sonneborni TaxID=65129 RepID=A0A8S1K6M4_9CILI|nr:unnamed protein product [Paramecium sonneborni]
MYQQQNQTQKLLKYLPDINDVVEGIQDFHLAIFLIQGTYFEISKRLTQIQFIFNRIPPNHNIKYKRIGQAYLLLLFLQFTKYLYNFIQKINNENIKDQVNKERNITTNESNDKFTQCLICYDNSTNVTCTPCGHLFCWDCIMQQINLKQQCPICRSDCQAQQLIQLYNYN